eukprot:3480633-Prymnesium_polylepis.1
MVRHKAVLERYAALLCLWTQTVPPALAAKGAAEVLSQPPACQKLKLGGPSRRKKRSTVSQTKTQAGWSVAPQNKVDGFSKDKTQAGWSVAPQK